ncbi:MAG: site-2 protease family protein [Actinomycetes bacterium]|jgi:Zn-dependent protease|nr:site-2 protease family protein [Actinomycetes bacterium]
MGGLTGTDALSTLLPFVVSFVLAIPALTLHEWAHGWVANRLGDDTPRMMGRLSINPLRHIDPVGTLLIPAMLLLASGGTFVFGYAKPVPINPRNFKDYKQGMLLTGIAGPVMNIIIAVVFGLVTRVVLAVAAGSGVAMLSAIAYLLERFVLVNLGFAFFNLIPIPPMDGSRVVQRFLRGRARQYYAMLERWGFLVVLGLLYFVPVVFDTYWSWTVIPIFRLLTGV